ncbi:MAG: HD-GYP domain-containing protein [Thermoguttaceae bacterium]
MTQPGEVDPPMAVPPPPIEPELAGFVSSAAKGLAEAFGPDFQVWALEDCPARLAPVSLGSQATSGSQTPLGALERRMEARLQAAMDAIEPVLLDQGDGQVLVGLPLGEAAGRRLAATATLKDCPADLGLRLARLCLNDLRLQRELHRCRDDLAVCAVQIGNDFEELAFLRTLADQLDVSDVSGGPWDVAELVLPLLAGVIRAESLVLLSAKPAPNAPSGVLVDRPVVWVGRRLGDELCRRLVQRFRAEAIQRPLVRNDLDRGPEAAEFPGVRKFVLTTLSKRDRVLGWLVALNHIRPGQTEPESALWKLSHMEFGTVEAGLLGSVASMLATHVCNVELVREKESLLIKLVRTMVSAIDAKDPYTCGHSERVALVSRCLARHLGMSQTECERVYLAGLLHDLGKLGVPDAVLRKPGRLTDEEFGLVRPHPEKGWGILRDLEELSDLFPGVLHHHERYDGTGYPAGLAGDQIPLSARILAVADAYDAMISDRPYRAGMPPETVQRVLREGAGSQWDPEVIETFFRALPEIEAVWIGYQQTGPRGPDPGCARFEGPPASHAASPA